MCLFVVVSEKVVMKKVKYCKQREKIIHRVEFTRNKCNTEELFKFPSMYILCSVIMNVAS